MYTQIKHNYNVNFLTSYMFVNFTVLQNSEILLIIRNQLLNTISGVCFFFFKEQ